MIINVKRVNDKFGFEATNEGGFSFNMDAKSAIGGSEQGFRPMELLLIGLGGCSAIDILNILYKQKQEVKDFEMEISGDREEGKHPSLFTNIVVLVKVKGQISEDKLQRAIDLTRDKYCPVYHHLSKTIEITYKYSVEDE